MTTFSDLKKMQHYRTLTTLKQLTNLRHPRAGVKTFVLTLVLTMDNLGILILTNYVMLKKGSVLNQGH